MLKSKTISRIENLKSSADLVQRCLPNFDPRKVENISSGEVISKLKDVVKDYRTSAIEQ